ncbi:DUF6584 family protein [Knoellia sp. S7-12]|uniref:DUF6584 family protein n=1 Tax=Knoellia sp. S7-12 TaxID=3126698 RepID=UPI00336669C2
MDALERARRDAADGRAWKARARLTGLLAHRPDAVVADELARVHHSMQDLPAAGALWFVTGRDGVVAQESVAAWREQHGDADAQWRAIPAPLRAAFASERHLIHLEAEAQEAERARIRRYQRKQRGLPPHESSAMERLGDIVMPTFWIVLALSLVALLGVGLWTVTVWILN